MIALDASVEEGMAPDVTGGERCAEQPDESASESEGQGRREHCAGDGRRLLLDRYLHQASSTRFRLASMASISRSMP
jgi:hypothetical protein